MNKYLIEVSKYFGGKIEFTVEAVDKADALEKAKHHISFYVDNCKKDTVKVVKKLQTSQLNKEW